MDGLNLKSNVLGKCAERFSFPFSAEDLQGDLARVGARVPIADIKAWLCGLVALKDVARYRACPPKP